MGGPLYSGEPFKRRHEEQIKLVTSFDWIDFDALSEVRACVVSSFEEAKERALTDDARIAAIADSVEARVAALQQLAQEHAPSQDSAEDDVEENVAADYTPKM